MTINFRTRPAIDVYVPNDNRIRLGDTFNIDFPFLETEDYIYVYLRKTDGTNLKLDLDIDYSVGLTDGTNSVYGMIVFNKKAFENISKICIRRNIVMDQPNQFSSQTLFSSTIERSFDKLTMMIQDNAIKEYLIQSPSDDTPQAEKRLSPASRFIHVEELEESQEGALTLPDISKRANKFLKFDMYGHIQMTDEPSDIVSIHMPLGDPGKDDQRVINSFAIPKDLRANNLLGFDSDGAVKFQKIDWDFEGKLDTTVRLSEGTFAKTLIKENIKDQILAFDGTGEPKCINNEFVTIKGAVSTNTNSIVKLKDEKIPEIERAISDLQGSSSGSIEDINGVKSKLSTLEESISGISGDLTKTNESITEAKKNIDKNQESITEAKSTIDDIHKKAIIASDGFTEVLDTKEKRANHYLKFNNDGNPIIEDIDTLLSTCLRSATGSLKPIEGNRANKYLAFDDKEEPILVTPSLGTPISPTYPRIYFVDKNNGIDSNTGLAFNTPLATISKAIEKINEVQEDSIIFVAPGEYAEKLQFNIMNNTSIHMYGANAILKGRIQTVSTSAYMNLAVSGTIGTFSIKPNVNIQTFALNPNLNDVIINWDTDILTLSQSTIKDAIGDTSDSYYKFQLNIRARTFTLNGLLTIELSKYTSHVKISAEDATLNAMVKIKDASLTSQAVQYNSPLNIMFDFKVWNVSLTESELFNVSLPKEIAFVLKLKGLNFYTNSTTPMLNITSNAANNYTLIDIDFDCSYFPDNITSLAYLNADAAIFINADLGITRMKYNFTPNDKIKITQSRWS